MSNVHPGASPGPRSVDPPVRSPRAIAFLRLRRDRVAMAALALAAGLLLA